MLTPAPQASCETEPVTVESKLEEAFKAYLNIAKAELFARKTEPPSQRPIQLLETKINETAPPC